VDITFFQTAVICSWDRSQRECLSINNHHVIMTTCIHKIQSVISNKYTTVLLKRKCKIIERYFVHIETTDEIFMNYWNNSYDKVSRHTQYIRILFLKRYYKKQIAILKEEMSKTEISHVIAVSRVHEYKLNVVGGVLFFSYTRKSVKSVIKIRVDWKCR